MTIVEELATHMVRGEFDQRAMQSHIALRTGGAPAAAQAISQARAMAREWCHDWQPVDGDAEEEPPRPPAHVAQVSVSYGRRKWTEKYQVLVDGRVAVATDTEASAKAEARRLADEQGGRYVGRVVIK